MSRHGGWEYYPLLILALFAVAWLLLLLAPGTGKQPIHFGVEVTPSFRGSPEARRLLRIFRRALVLSGLPFALLLMVTSITSVRRSAELIFLVGMFCLGPSFTLLFAWGRSYAQWHAATAALPLVLGADGSPCAPPGPGRFEVLAITCLPQIFSFGVLVVWVILQLH